MPRGRVPGVGRPLVDAYRNIAVNQLPPPGCRTGWRWAQEGAEIGFATLLAEHEAVMLDYTWCSTPGAPWRSALLTIKLAWSPRHFGGAQRYLVCPGCRRRAVKLFDIRSGRFVCRRCGGLTYESQRVGTWLRALQRSYKIRERLGGEPAAMAAFPQRPKWMRRQTYERLRDKALAFEAIPPDAWHMPATRNIKVRSTDAFRTASLANRR
jgi:hypothetical protein